MAYFLDHTVVYRCSLLFWSVCPSVCLYVCLLVLIFMGRAAWNKEYTYIHTSVVVSCWLKSLDFNSLWATWTCEFSVSSSLLHYRRNCILRTTKPVIDPWIFKARGGRWCISPVVIYRKFTLELYAFILHLYFVGLLFILCDAIRRNKRFQIRSSEHCMTLL